MENKYKNLCIKINSHAEKLAALYFFAEKVGCKIGSAGLDYALDSKGSLGGKYVYFNGDVVSGTGWTDDRTIVPFSDLKNFDNYIKPQFVEVVLNKEHTAKVYKDKIVVGCQNFPISIIDDLVAAKAKIS